MPLLCQHHIVRLDVSVEDPLKTKKMSFNRVIGDNMKDYSLIEIQKKQVFQLDVSVEDPLKTKKDWMQKKQVFQLDERNVKSIIRMKREK